MKKLRCLCAVLGLSVLLSTTAYAQWEKTGTTWKYQTNGTYYNDGWHWIDGNNDSIAECYYFGSDGIMLANCTTPDNYIVDINGAWTVNGVVQTKVVGDNTSSHGSTGQASVGNVPTNQPTTPETPTPTPPTTGGGNANPATNPENSWFFDGWDTGGPPVGGSGPIDDLHTN